jgi:uncharacterized coiled-coil protein SlyX
MSDQPENIILVYLRRLDETMDSIRHDIREVKQRMTSLEAQTAQQHSGLASLHNDFAGQSLRLDRLDQRLDRIERRLDLIPAT